MADAWVYIDESQCPHPTSDPDMPFSIGALVTTAPIGPEVVREGMATLGADPDANRHDRETLARGHFHASLDSKNAHSALCHAITRNGISATFTTTRWYFGREGSETHSGGRLHRMAATLSVEAVMNHDFDAVHMVVARREGSFDDAHIEAWPQHCRELQFGAMITMPGRPLPSRYPMITSESVGSEHPGVQVCDFVLWAVQRARPAMVSFEGKRDWVDYLKLRPRHGGGVENGPLQAFVADLGDGASKAIAMPKEAPGARAPEDFDDDEAFELTMEIAGDVRAAATRARSSRRIGHLADELAGAGEAVAQVLGRDSKKTTEALNALMMAFFVVCDTLPIYDAADPRSCKRASEKRSFAAAFLAGRRHIWLPLDARL